jgi:hypothetical protein
MSGQPSASAGEHLSTLLADDGRYLFRSLYSDGVDPLKLPLRFKEVRLTDVMIATVVLGTIPATIYGLDDPLRRNAKHIPDSTAGNLTTIGQGTTLGSVGLLYGWGLYGQNEAARHAVLTGAEGIGLSSLFTVGIKAAFGRQRPKTGEGPRAFFQGGQSFPRLKHYPDIVDRDEVHRERQHLTSPEGGRKATIILQNTTAERPGTPRLGREPPGRPDATHLGS